MRAATELEAIQAAYDKAEQLFPTRPWELLCLEEQFGKKQKHQVLFMEHDKQRVDRRFRDLMDVAVVSR